MATLRNDSGGYVDDLHVWYDFGSWLPSANENVHGHRTYYSLTGAPDSWQLIPEFSQFSQTSATGETTLAASLSLGSWAPGAPLYVLWADDNGLGGSQTTGSGREGAYTINNFTVSLATAMPVTLDGIPVQGFDNTPSPLFWSTYSMPGASSDTGSAAALDAKVQELSADDVATFLDRSGTWPPGTSQIAVWNTQQELLQTRPTGNTGTAVMATLRNQTGEDVAGIEVSFD